MKQAVDEYLKKGYTDIMISFGCTGGIHRSVYFSEKIKKFLQDINVEAELYHNDLKKVKPGQ